MDKPTQRYKLTIAYRGTAYHGWQQQGYSGTWKGAVAADGSGPPTIQEICKKAIEGVVMHPVIINGSSRTDAGVHAKGQVAHFDTHMTMIPMEGLRRGVNSRLPEDILVKKIEAVPSTFDAQYSTESKRYQYVIWNSYDRPPFFGDLVFHRFQKMDLDAVRAAAQLIEGTHDFNAFAKPGHKRASTIRTVHECSISYRSPRIVVGVTGSGFLWNMVRIIVGTLVEVGIGRIKVEDIPKIMETRDRRNAGNTAPAQGLYLQWIKFKPENAPPSDAEQIEEDVE